MNCIRLGVIGAGLMGLKHIDLVRTSSSCVLAGISDLDHGRKPIAEAAGVPFYRTPEDLIKSAKPDAVIIATPNAHHTAIAETCASRSVHMLIEKPLADTLPQAIRIAGIAAHHGVRVLVGHHRRHSPFILKARELVRGGALGKLTGVSALWAIMKPDEYFNVKWRCERDVGGPLLINLVHDLDSLRFICGEITDVHARTTSAVRGLEVEDSLVISISFENGALGSILASDATPAAWSYEATVGENPLYFHTSENCYHFLGSSASLAFPKMELWHYPDAARRGWQHPMECSRIKVTPADPLQIQLEHFCRVVRGETTPVMDAADGIKSLAAALAVQQSARRGIPIAPAQLISGIIDGHGTI